jgi:hypothetical protein
MRPRRRDVCIVPKAKSADPPDSGHALIEADEATIHGAFVAPVLGAPRIVLGFGCSAEYDCED